MSKSKLQYVSDIPHLYAQWDQEKNGDLLATEATPGMGRKVWWLCDKGHSWKAAIANRTRGSRCPYCLNQKILPGYNDLAHLVPEVAQQWDQGKNGTLTPEMVGRGSSKKAWWLCSKGHSWEAIIASRTRLGAGCPYCAGKRVIPGETDLVTTHPRLAKQWDYKKNGKLAPVDISAGSERKIWWVCDLGHSYQMTTYNRTSRKPQNCPYCSHKRLLPGFNDLTSTHPDLMRQWDWRKNSKLSPYEVTAGMGKKVWWICDKGHSWEAALLNRKKGSGCPYCSGNRVLHGETDLEAMHPELMKQWDWDKNTNLKPGELPARSKLKAWWICNKGHSWEALITNRSKGVGCPYCSGNLALPGFNDLATVSPELCLQWDYEKNGKLLPNMVTPGSGRKVWWLCDSGHSWKTRVAERKRSGCPHCVQNTSEAEREIAEFLSDLVGSGKIITSDRKTIGPQELDIHIPDLKIAIEYNGVYWHSEAFIDDKRHHYNKWKKCKDQGIQLITIWEDQWRDNQDLVKNMLAHKLGVSQDQRVFARKTTVAKVDNRTAREFCDKYHIQGFAPGSTYLGLEDSEGNLVALSIWRKNKTDLYLDRYCTSVSVVGGMGKLLNAGRQFARENNLSQIITFADHDVSDGGLYEKLGFTHDGELSPDYKYLVNGERKHKFGYRLKCFRNDPELLYEEGLTETQLAKLNGLERIWDIGKTRYAMEV